jgi:hypothetical protein
MCTRIHEGRGKGRGAKEMKRYCPVCDYNELYDLDATVCEDCNYEMGTGIDI